LSEDKSLKATYQDKKVTECPVCSCEFYREILMSGGGRLIAGQLTDELRRLYQPSKKYGRINPLIYPLIVCPDCLYAAYPEDFSKVGQKKYDALRSFTERRRQLVLQTFGEIDFFEPRDDKTGAACYILGVSCYSFFDASICPTMKRGLCSLRAGWMLGDLIEITEREAEKNKYTHVQKLMYEKANQFYSASLDLLQTGKERNDAVVYGPDVDKNWGYDGYLYTVSNLSMKMGYLIEDPEERAMGYIKAKRAISKLFGSGKASKAKPGEILDLSRDVYNQLDAYVKEIEESLGKKLD
jgi:hypothetical protein